MKFISFEIVVVENFLIKNPRHRKFSNCNAPWIRSLPFALLVRKLGKPFICEKNHRKLEVALSKVLVEKTSRMHFHLRLWRHFCIGRVWRVFTHQEWFGGKSAVNIDVSSGRGWILCYKIRPEQGDVHKIRFNRRTSLSIWPEHTFY